MYEIFEKLIKERGLSLYRVSKDTGIPLSSLSDWKKGRYKSPKAERLQVLADYLGVSVSALLGTETEETAPDPLAGVVSRRLDDDDFRSVVSQAVKLSPPMLRHLRAYLELIRQEEQGGKQ